MEIPLNLYVIHFAFVTLSVCRLILRGMLNNTEGR